ncbi:MAG: hypothetical protein JO222_15645 [Frankiales bacterium]|nr:hypothetical protein [Frankiales bacterium]
MGASTATSPPSRRDVAYAACLALVLGIGVLGVLLLNTAMQQQARQLTRVQQHIAALTEQAQLLQADVDRNRDPQLLAQRARALHLRPARNVLFLTPAGVSRPRGAAGRGHAG